MPTGVRRPILALVSYFEQFYRLSSGLEHINLSHMAKHLFLNNILFDQQHSNLRLFAGDCVLYKEVATQQDCQILQQDLHLLPHWPKTWQLSFNVSKCCHLGITRKKTPLNLIIPWMASLSQELLLQCISGYHGSLVCVFPFRGSLPFIISR